MKFFVAFNFVIVCCIAEIPKVKQDNSFHFALKPVKEKVENVVDDVKIQTAAINDENKPVAHSSDSGETGKTIKTTTSIEKVEIKLKAELEEPTFSPDVQKNKYAKKTSSTLKKIDGSCDCAVFIGVNPDKTSKPLSVLSPLNVTCNVLGQKTCFNACTQLKMEHCPAVLCSKLDFAIKFKAVSFIRVCSDKWISTGFSSKNDICCHNNIAVPCSAQNTTKEIN